MYSVTVTRTSTVYEEMIIEVEALDLDAACTLAEEHAARDEDGPWVFLDREEFKYDSKVTE